MSRLRVKVTTSSRLRGQDDVLRRDLDADDLEPSERQGVEVTRCQWQSKSRPLGRPQGHDLCERIMVMRYRRKARS